MIDEFATAVLARLRADTKLLRVYDGAPPDKTAAPYVVVWVSTDNEGSERLTVDTSHASLRVITHSVGDTAQGARIIASRVRDALLDVRMPVAGYRAHPLRHEYGLPPTADQSTGHWVLDAIDGWTATYQRAT